MHGLNALSLSPSPVLHNNDSVRAYNIILYIYLLYEANEKKQQK